MEREQAREAILNAWFELPPEARSTPDHAFAFADQALDWLPDADPAMRLDVIDWVMVQLPN